MLMTARITYALDLVYGFESEDTIILDINVCHHAAGAVQFLSKCGALVTVGLRHVYIEKSERFSQVNGIDEGGQATMLELEDRCTSAIPARFICELFDIETWEDDCDDGKDYKDGKGRKDGKKDDKDHKYYGTSYWNVHYNY
ncbi:hypothetical protein IW262DRAFT_1294813 [Armillaria fumosa]|nr:hypothetical protein IW262DRAFT_1294813 [Armillaria fumosa]